MATSAAHTWRVSAAGTDTMRAAVFEGPDRIVLAERPIPACGLNDAIVKVTMTTICGTDVHILRGEYPVAPGRIVGHEPVGVIHELGAAVEGYTVGQRVLVGAITPCGSCFFCQHHVSAQCSGHRDEWEMIGGWRLGNSMDGVQADYFRVAYAQGNLAPIPDDMTDEQCLMLADTASTGISAVETADVKIGDTVAVFAQGPIGLCATAGARLKGAALVIGIDAIEKRLHLSREMGADEVVDFTQQDPVAAIKRLTGGRGVDVAVEALGLQQTFQWCLEATRPGGTVSSLGVYGGKLEVPVEPFVYGIGDKRILTSLCPGGKARMRTLMELVGRIIPCYMDRGIVERSPFGTIDEDGVGALVRMGVERGRAAQSQLEVGICGEHGGDPDSIRFFHRAGLDYVSCSPFRLPIARVAAAQAALEA